MFRFVVFVSSDCLKLLAKPTQGLRSTVLFFDFDLCLEPLCEVFDYHVVSGTSSNCAEMQPGDVLFAGSVSITVMFFWAFWTDSFGYSLRVLGDRSAHTI